MKQTLIQDLLIEQTLLLFLPKTRRGEVCPPPLSGSDSPVYNSVPGLGVSMQLSIAGICLVQETREQGKKKAAD